MSYAISNGSLVARGFGVQAARLLLAVCVALCSFASAGIAQEDSDAERAADEAKRQQAKEDAKLFRKATQGLNKAIRSGDLDTIAYWVEEMGSVGTVKAIKVVLMTGEKYPVDPVSSSVISTLVLAKNDEILAFYGKELDHVNKGSVNRAILIIEALDRMGDKEATAKIVKLLEKATDQRLLITAINSLRRRPTAQSISALVAFYKRIEESRDKLWQETLISLMVLTDQEYTLSADWENWWLINRDTWIAKRKIRRSKLKQASTAVHRPKDRSVDLPVLFGQEVASKRVAFVIDCSLSMAEKDEVEGSESGKNTTKVRLKRAQRELVKVIDKLRADVKFNIIGFSTDLYPWQTDKMLLATKSNKRKANKFVMGLKPTEYTNTGDALMMALELPGIDTIILLSDGSPTDTEFGETIDVDPILDAVKKENRFKKITIHTLGFKGVKESFMKSLARSSGGTYARIR